MKKIKAFILIFILIVLPGFGLKCQDKEVTQAMQPIALNYWRVWDGPDDFKGIIEGYSKLHPNIKINYRKLRYEEYEQAILEAYANDNPPDIFSIHNTWIRKYQDKIAAMPDQTTLAYPIVKGSLKKETIIELHTKPSLTIKDLKNKFVDVVNDDVVIEAATKTNKKVKPRIFALPLSVDSLVLYYNKDLFNNEGIINIPEFWNEAFQENVKALTKFNAEGEIIQSGIALGTSNNIDRSSDILSLLMMQNGAEMMSADGTKVLFTSKPGAEALRFYADFANSSKEVYTWNSKLGNSIDMFVQGKLAMLLGYAYDLPTIKAKGSKINLGIAPLPQIEGNLQKINYANYWVETVSSKSKNSEPAWDFLQFAADEKNVKSYLEKTKKPTALRSLIEWQKADMDLELFADQITTAKSWYRGKNSNAMEKIMKEMIDQMNAGGKEISDIINVGAQKIQQTLN